MNECVVHPSRGCVSTARHNCPTIDHPFALLLQFVRRVSFFSVNSPGGDSQTRARRVRSAVVFQAVWRGRCTRASVSQIRAARRQELEEVNGMYQEEQLATRLAACEANQKKEERINQAREQSSMRYVHKKYGVQVVHAFRRCR